MRGIHADKVNQLREGLRADSFDDFRLFVRRQVAEQNGRLHVSPELQEAARLELGPGGYWSAEAVADRIMGFALALAGDGKDQAKLQVALDAVRKGFDQAERVLGKLADVSHKTRSIVEQRFEALLTPP